MKKEVVDFGNASNQTGRPHIRTCPSVLKSLQDACKHTTTAKAYKVMLLKYRLQQFCSHETQSKWKTSDHAEATFVTWCTLQSPWTGCWLARFCTSDTHTSWSDMHLQQQRTAVMSWIECFWYSPQHLSCCHMTQLFNWVIFMYQHLLSDTHSKNEGVIFTPFRSNVHSKPFHS